MGMKNPDTPRRIRQVSVQKVGTELLVYDECRNMAFCLNESSAMIWKLANGERTVAQIGAEAAAELKAGASEELVIFALSELRRDGLVEPFEAHPADHTVSRRELLQRLGVSGAMLLPVVAAIVAPTPAQAYSGCVDCTSAPSAQAAQAARLRSQRQLNRSSTVDPLTNATELPQ